MTAWKARMLEELYRAADAELAGDGRLQDRDHERTERVRDEALALWDGDPVVLGAYLSSMPVRYLLSNPVEAVVAHARVVAARGDKRVHAAFVPSRHRDVAELCVVAVDRPGLLARIAAAITAGRLEVLGAQVYSRTPGVVPAAVRVGARETEGVTEAVDIFWVGDRVDGLEGAQRAVPRLLRDLEQVCTEEGDAAARLLRTRTGSPWRERPRRACRPRSSSTTAPPRTTPSSRCSRRTGRGSSTASPRPSTTWILSIAISKINTEGTCVADVFYVQERDGTKVAPGERFREIGAKLREVIDEP